MIGFEEFQKINLRVAEIVSAQKVEGSEKLLNLKIDLGLEKRQIVSGIAEFYEPEDLVGKQIVVVENLEPKKIFGLESRGMLLAVDDNGQIALLQPDKRVVPGSKVC
jgi:methionine--tRNA ligase beta chain